MRRIHFHEIHEQVWCPSVVRDGLTDFLQVGMRATNMFRHAVPMLAEAMERVSAKRVVDLCAGGGGPWQRLSSQLRTQVDGVEVVLTDAFPSASARVRVASLDASVAYESEAVDARRVPRRLRGMRTLFNAFHQFEPDDARQILQDAVDAGDGIAVFEATHRSWWSLFLMLGLPALVFLGTPFIRPFSWSRLFWTYVIPVIPLVVMHDGIVSCLRTYTLEELDGLVSSIDAPNYTWSRGVDRVDVLGNRVTYLVGTPA